MGEFCIVNFTRQSARLVTGPIAFRCDFRTQHQASTDNLVTDVTRPHFLHVNDLPRSGTEVPDVSIAGEAYGSLHYWSASFLMRSRTSLMRTVAVTWC